MWQLEASSFSLSNRVFEGMNLSVGQRRLTSSRTLKIAHVFQRGLKSADHEFNHQVDPKSVRKSSCVILMLVLEGPAQDRRDLVSTCVCIVHMCVSMDVDYRSMSGCM